MKNFKLLFLLTIISLSIAACKKGDKGDTGPAGPTGATGATGATGTANVTDTFFSAATWINAAGNSTEWRYDFIDSSMDLSAGVQVYFYEGGNNWMAMPFTYHSLEWLYEVFRDNHKIELTMTTVSGTTALTQPVGTTFRVVTIPVGHRLAHPEVDYIDFNQVKKAFHLKDIVLDNQ
jgi:hypothetical protein